VAIWTLCLMPNHVHLIAVPGNETGLAVQLARPTVVIPDGSISGRTGAVIYGRKGLPLFPWMSCTCLIDVLPLLDLISDWEGFLRLSTAEELKVQKLHERTGRPLGNDQFLEKMEVTLGRVLKL